MPISADEITAVDKSTVKPTKTQGKAAPAAGELPDELLEKVPALQLLLNGSPPATFAPKAAEYPELDTVTKHIKDLGKAGFGVYGTKDGANVVLFNGLYVTPEEIAQADEAGQLAQVAAPYDELRSAFEGAASEAGATAQASETSGAPSGSPAAPQPAGAPPAASTQNKLATARIDNLAVGAPTTGPVPGQGRILNNILKPVV